MATYLLTWNPKRTAWEEELDKCIQEIEEKGFHEENWSCGRTKKIRPGDRVFMLKQGEEPRGIMASGWVTRGVYARKHWAEKGKKALYVDVRFDVILNPKERIFPRAWLDQGIYAEMYWDVRSSGVRIPDPIAEQLEKDWAQFLQQSASR